MGAEIKGKDRRVRVRAFTRVDKELDAWFDREAIRQGIKKATLMRHALVQYKRGIKGIILDPGQADWLEIYNRYWGGQGDVATIRALTIIASRAFVDASVALRAREWADQLSPPAPPRSGRSGGSDGEQPPRRGAQPAYAL